MIGKRILAALLVDSLFINLLEIVISKALLSFFVYLDIFYVVQYLNNVY